MSCNKCILAVVGGMFLSCVIGAVIMALNGKDCSVFTILAASVVGVISKSALDAGGNKDANNP